MSDGTINVANGLLSMAVMADPTVLYDALVRAGEPYVWDQPEQDLSRDFLETIQFPGDVLVSPITFRPVAQSQKEMQAVYYLQKRSQEVCRWASNTDQGPRLPGRCLRLN